MYDVYVCIWFPVLHHLKSYIFAIGISIMNGINCITKTLFTIKLDERCPNYIHFHFEKESKWHIVLAKTEIQPSSQTKLNMFSQ